MKVLTTSDSAQTLKVIPRSYPAIITVKLRDESLNTTATFSDVSATNVQGYLTFSETYSLVENHFYELTILDGSDVIYRDKVFCSDQTIDQDTNSYYTVNSNVYEEEDSYDNDFIVL